MKKKKKETLKKKKKKSQDLKTKNKMKGKPDLDYGSPPYEK